MKPITLKYKPIDYQKAFHDSVKPKVFLSGGYGCLVKGSPIETLDGIVPIEEIKSGTVVKTWKDGEFCWSLSTKAIPQPVQDIYRVTHDFGSFVCSAQHPIFLGHYNYELAVSCLGKQVVYAPSYFDNPWQTILELCRLLLSLNDQRYWKKVLDLRERCLVYSRQYDQLLLSLKDIGQEFSPLLDDAVKSVQPFCPSVFEHMDALWVLTPKRSHLDLLYNHLCNIRSFYQMGISAEASANQTQALPLGCIFEVIQLIEKSLSMIGCHRKEGGSSLGSLIYCHDTYFSSPAKTTITQIEHVGKGEVFDLHVLGTNNYLSGNIVHHNSGKTYSLIMKMFSLMNTNKGLPGGLLCPTIKMAKRDVIPTLVDICLKNNIPFRHHQTDNYFYFPATRSKVFIFHGEDKGYSIRGPNLAFMCINEGTLIDQQTFNAALSRVRLKKAALRQVAMSGSPEGFTWHYEYFIEHPREDTDVIFGDVRKNTYISEDYVQMLTDSYDSLTAQQYVEGKFVNLTGNRAAWSFNRAKHVAPVHRDPHLPVWVSMDFNVYPMTAVLWNSYSNREQVWLKAFDEIFIDGAADTWEMCDTIWERLGGKHQDCEIVVYPDPAGKARSTKSRHLTDIDIIQQCGFKNVKFRSRIISVRDCLNSLNALLDKKRILIDPKCKNLIADFERCIIKPGGTEIDKSDKKRGHLLDGAKNMAEYEFRIDAKRETFSQFRIR